MFTGKLRGYIGDVWPEFTGKLNGNIEDIRLMFMEEAEW